MKSILVELQCRKCMYHTYRKSETLILSDFETQAKEALMDGTFFSLRCPCCKEIIQFLHPLAYVDKDHHFIVLIKAEKDIQKRDKYLYEEDKESKKRLLHDPTKIAEKIHIFEDELDDCVIEIMKWKLYSRYQNKLGKHVEITYHDFDISSDTLWFSIRNKEHDELLAVMKESYDKLAKNFGNYACDHFIKVDQQWVLDNYIK